MTQAASAKVTKLNRVERNAWTKQKIFEAATRVVGKYGYAEASVARITEQAGVAQGTFYNHFVNRQELLDQLLPKIGIHMVRFIRDRTRTRPAPRQEVERFAALFGLIRRGPEILPNLQQGRSLCTRRLPEASRQCRDRLCPHPAARKGGRQHRRLQRRGVRGNRAHADGRTRLSQPALLLRGGRRRRGRARSRQDRLREADHARADQAGGQAEMSESIVLITGGSRGIGAATATLLAEQGKTVVIVDIQPEPIAGAIL